MPIDFHAEQNRYSYASREADPSWATAVSQITSPVGKIVYDIGCGGGIYSRAWAALGASEVIGVDFSAQAVHAAVEQTTAPNITYQTADASRTGLPEQSADIVFARALIHHLSDLPSFFAEAFLLLKAGGLVLLQSRTHEDVRQPGSTTHIRGYYFNAFPKLLAVEDARRHSAGEIEELLQLAGFGDVQSTTFWETHAYYPTFDSFAQNLRQRRSSSILHELSDEEVELLTLYIERKMDTATNIIMSSRFTFWRGRRL